AGTDAPGGRGRCSGGRRRAGAGAGTAGPRADGQCLAGRRLAGARPRPAEQRPVAGPTVGRAACRPEGRRRPRPAVLRAGRGGREVLEALLARPDRVAALLSAVEEKKVQLGQIEPARLDQLRRLPEAAVRRRAQSLLAGLGSPDRRKVIAAYQQALELKADV